MTAGPSRSSPSEGETNPFEAALDRESPQLPALPVLPPRPMAAPAPPPAMPPLPHYGPPPPLSAPVPRSPRPDRPAPTAPPRSRRQPSPRPESPAPAGRRSRRRREPGRVIVHLPRLIANLERVLRGRILIGLFVFWALFWLLGGVAIVRLLKMEQSAEVLPLQVGPNTTATSDLPGNTRDIPRPSDSQRNFQQPSANGAPNPAANGTQDGFGSLQPMVRPQRSGPPLGLLAGVVVICSLGTWVRLQQMNRRP